MRDVKRIDRICDLLRAEWHKHPDLRLGQLISNLVGRTPVFYAEDDVIERALTPVVKDPAKIKAVFEAVVKEVQKHMNCSEQEAREFAQRTQPKLSQEILKSYNEIKDRRGRTILLGDILLDEDKIYQDGIVGELDGKLAVRLQYDSMVLPLKDANRSKLEVIGHILPK